MRSLWVGGLAAVLAAVAGCGGNPCGAGTVKSGSVCVPDPSLAHCGPSETLQSGTCIVDPTLAHCDAGTFQSGTQCVPNPLFGPTPWGNVLKVSDQPTGAGWQNEPSIVVDGAGQVTVAWQAYFPGTGNITFRSSSTDQGRTFAPSTAMDGPYPSTSMISSVGDVTTTTDPAGTTVYVGWTRYARCQADGGFDGGPCGGAILVAEAPSGTTTFGPPTEVNNLPYTTDVDRPWLSIDPMGGDLFAVYDDFTVGVRQIQVALPSVTSIQGDGYLNERIGSEGLSQGNGPVAFDQLGGWFFAPEYLYRRSSNLRFARWTSAGFAENVIPLPGGLYSSLWHEIRTRAQVTNGFTDGSYCLVYQNANADTVTVEALRWENGAWATSAVRVSDPLPGSRDYVWMAQDEHQNVHVVWLDNRSGQGWQPVTAHSSDGCRTFGPNLVVSAVPFVDDGQQADFIGDFIAIAARGGRMYVAWADTRTGRPEVFVASAASPFP